MSSQGHKISVAILSHNYGEFLPTAIQSILGQTMVPTEIIVIDDSSNDNTRKVAELFSSRNVVYKRVDYQNVLLSRRTALEMTKGKYVCILDADDYVDPLYFENGISEFEKDYRTGIVYSDVRFFGINNKISRYPANSTVGDITIENYIHSGAIFRRDAAEVSQAFYHSGPKERHEDWMSWRKILAMGYTAVKQKSLYYYRIHDKSLSIKRHVGRSGYIYPESAALSEEEITLFTPLAGRTEIWKEFKYFLENQHWDHKKIHLIMMDTSENSEFSDMIKDWLSKCDYASYQYIPYNTGFKDLADIARVDEEHGNSRQDVLENVRTVMARIYNRIRNIISTNYLWIIEDDVIPPLNAYEKLINSFTHETVSVSGAVPHRYEDAYIVWDKNGSLTEGKGVQRIKGNGFGCVLLRAKKYKQHVFTYSKDSPDFDMHFYENLTEHEHAKIDWSIVCRHLSPMYTFSTGKFTPISSSEFDEEYYLEMNEDVKQALEAGVIKSAYHHYSESGFFERRMCRKKNVRSSVSAESCSPEEAEKEIEMLEASQKTEDEPEAAANIQRASFEINRKHAPEMIREAEFDVDFYLQANPDIEEALKDGTILCPYKHYHENGFSEDRAARKLPHLNPCELLPRPFNEQPSETVLSIQRTISEEAEEISLVMNQIPYTKLRESVQGETKPQEQIAHEVAHEITHEIAHGSIAPSPPPTPSPINEQETAESRLIEISRNERNPENSFAERNTNASLNPLDLLEKLF